MERPSDIATGEQGEQRRSTDAKPDKPPGTTPLATPSGILGSIVPYSRGLYLRTPCDHLVLPP
ncbi:hypothetical protein GCM10027290_37770 [Micromonospora sonneratiae]